MSWNKLLAIKSEKCKIELIF